MQRQRAKKEMDMKEARSPRRQAKDNIQLDVEEDRATEACTTQDKVMNVVERSKLLHLTNGTCGGVIVNVVRWRARRPFRLYCPPLCRPKIKYTHHERNRRDFFSKSPWTNERMNDRLIFSISYHNPPHHFPDNGPQTAIQYPE
jgi:hypothetical protein